MKVKQKFFDLFEAIDKISANEWCLVEDVKDLLKNRHEGVIFFVCEDLQNFVKTYRRHRDKGMEAKANNDAGIFIEWMENQLKLAKSTK